MENEKFFFDCKDKNYKIFFYFLNNNKIEIAKLILFKELVRFKLKISIIYFFIFQELLTRFFGCFYSFNEEDR